ncbi:unnamed protein product [Clavelina lepadiformis]|uniref:Uncharacterized protein n=1 Tax=Clavelina lepadiformis TaxID=159417 RepID=A0ABP0FYY2_CLALP
MCRRARKFRAKTRFQNNKSKESGSRDDIKERGAWRTADHFQNLQDEQGSHCDVVGCSYDGGVTVADPTKTAVRLTARRNQIIDTATEYTTNARGATKTKLQTRMEFGATTTTGLASCQLA